MKSADEILGSAPGSKTADDFLGVANRFLTGMSGEPEVPRGPVAPLTGQMVLPTILSIFGSLAGAPGGKLGKAAGAGVGAALGVSLNPDVMGAMGYEPPPRPSLWEVAKVGGLAAVFDLIGQASGSVLQPKADAGKTIDAMRAIGVAPKVTDVAGSTVPAATERSLVQTLGGRQVIVGTVQRQVEGVGRAKDEFLARLSPDDATDVAAVGSRAQIAVGKQIARVGEVEDYLWQELRGMATDQPVNLASLKKLAGSVERDQLNLLPSKRNGKLLELSQEILKEPETTSWQRVDAWRRDFGASIKQSDTFAGMSRDQSERFYAASLQDMERAAATADVPGLGRYFQEVRAFGSRARGLFNESQIAKIMDADPEQVVTLLKAGGGPSALDRAKAAIMGGPEYGQAMPNPEARDTYNLLRRHIIESGFIKATEKNAIGLGVDAISATKLEKVFDRATVNVLLDPAERTALENITLVNRAIRGGERAGANAYTSSTGQTIAVNTFLATIGSGSGAAIGGPAGAVVGSVLSNLAIPAVVAKLLTSPTAAAFVASPRFTQAASGMATANRVTGEGARALLRLGAITAAEAGRAERAPQR